MVYSRVGANANSPTLISMNCTSCNRLDQVLCSYLYFLDISCVSIQVLIKKTSPNFKHDTYISNLMMFGLCANTHISFHQILCMTHEFSYFIEVVLNIFGSFIFFYMMLAFTIINCLFFIVDRGLVSPFEVFFGS
jgi:hypothetical protein